MWKTTVFVMNTYAVLRHMPCLCIHLRSYKCEYLHGMTHGDRNLCLQRSLSKVCISVTNYIAIQCNNSRGDFLKKQIRKYTTMQTYFDSKDVSTHVGETFVYINPCHTFQLPNLIFY